MARVSRSKHSTASLHPEKAWGALHDTKTCHLWYDFEVQVTQPLLTELRWGWIGSWEQTRRIQDCHCHYILHLFPRPSVTAPQVLEYDFEADRWKTNVSFRSGGKKRRRTGAPFSSACLGCPCPCAASHLRDVIHNPILCRSVFENLPQDCASADGRRHDNWIAAWHIHPVSWAVRRMPLDLIPSPDASSGASRDVWESPACVSLMK